MTLPSVPDLDALARTRTAWHALAEQVLGAARYRADGRIGLRVTPGGFGTPAFGSGVELRIAGRDLVVDGTASGTTVRLSTLAAAAAVVGIEPGPPVNLYPPATMIPSDAPLQVDDQAALVLAAWFALGDTALHTLRSEASAGDAPSEIQLWPEHFDLALELGDIAAHRAAPSASPPATPSTHCPTPT